MGFSLKSAEQDKEESIYRCVCGCARERERRGCSCGWWYGSMKREIHRRGADRLRADKHGEGDTRIILHYAIHAAMIYW